MAVDRAGQDGSQVLMSLTVDQEPPSIFLYKHWLPMVLQITGDCLAASAAVQIARYLFGI